MAMTLIFALLKKSWPYVLTAIVVIALCAYGLHWLHKRDATQYAAGQAQVKGLWDAETAAREAAQLADAAKQATIQAHATGTALTDAATAQANQETVHTVYKTIIQRVHDHATDHPDNLSCALDADAVRLWNDASSAATDVHTTTDSTRNDSADVAGQVSTTHATTERPAVVSAGNTHQ